MIAENRWEIVEWKLFAGFENGNVIPSPNPNQFTVLGGKLNFGDSIRVWTYDLVEKSILNNKHLHNKSILTKHCVLSQDRAMIIGEADNSKYFWEVYDSRPECGSPSEKGFIDMPSQFIEKLKQYNYNQPNLMIPKDESLKIDFGNRDYSKKSILFGSDIEPFQIEVDGETGHVDIQSVPTSLDLSNFQGMCRIDHNQIFLAGGISNKLTYISDKAYVYNLNTREVKEAGQMRQIRYTFPVVHSRGYVYCIGGREFGGDSEAVMCYTERYCLETEEWESLPPLNVKRCTSHAFTIRGKVFVAGGYNTAKNRIDSIEVFNEARYRWELFGIKMTKPLEAGVQLVKDDRIFFFGGRTNDGDCKKKEFIDMSRGDLGQPELMDSKMTHAGCLNKIVYSRGFFFIFGGDNMENIDILREDDLSMVSKDLFSKKIKQKDHRRNLVQEFKDTEDLDSSLMKSML